MQESQASGGKNPVRPINHSHKVGSNLHWFALNYSLTSIATAWAVKKRNWGQQGVGMETGSFPAFFFHTDWIFRRDGGWGEEDGHRSPCGSGKKILWFYLDGRCFHQFKVDFQDFYLLFYIFSTAIRYRTLTFIKRREREAEV